MTVRCGTLTDDAGYRLQWLFVNTAGDLASSDSYSKSVTRLRNSLSKNLGSGALLSSTDNLASGSAPSAHFATRAVDRSALLRAFRTSEVCQAPVNDPVMLSGWLG